ncbi:hypothetical protein PQX77_017509 [Marasmius sp. AFHP31]|nr:hypothetical protein PQX77_017509 [Marasmius sp. AFHP31]
MKESQIWTIFGASGEIEWLNMHYPENRCFIQYRDVHDTERILVPPQLRTHGSLADEQVIKAWMGATGRAAAQPSAQSRTITAVFQPEKTATL